MVYLDSISAEKEYPDYTIGLMYEMTLTSLLQIKHYETPVVPQSQI